MKETKGTEGKKERENDRKEILGFLKIEPFEVIHSILWICEIVVYWQHELSTYTNSNNEHPSG